MCTQYNMVTQIRNNKFFLEVSSWAPVSCGYNQKWIQKEVVCWFGSCSINILIEPSCKFDSWKIIFVSEQNFMFYKAKKHLSQNSCHRIHNSACGGVTKEKFCMIHHNGLYSYKNVIQW